MGDVQREIDALSSPIRREILWRLWSEELPAGAIAAAFEVTAPTVSSHLRILREAGLVTTRVAGTFRYYRANRDALRRVQPLLEPSPGRWEPADDLPEQASTSVARATTVVVSTVLPVAAADAFRAMTDAALFSRWLGVPVAIEGDVLACELEWGTKVRGRYEHVVAPSFIHFEWTLDDGTTPTPGAEVPAYLHFDDVSPSTSRVEVRQVVDDEEQASFMEVAWGMVLGRLHDGVVEALGGDGRRRPRRAKRRS